MTTIGFVSFDKFLLYFIFSDIKSCLAALSDFFSLFGFIFFLVIYYIKCEGISANVYLANVTSPLSKLN